MSKSAISSFKFAGDLSALHQATQTACERMSLKVKAGDLTESGFLIKASERMKWLTTNWPVSFKISAEKVGSEWAVIVAGGSSMGSITQDHNNQQKAAELANLIKTLVPGTVSQ